MPRELPKIKETSEQIKRDVRAKTIGYILTALGLVAGLAWNDAITSIINQLFPFGKTSAIAKTIYAVIITIIVVTVSVYLTRFATKEKKNN